ncbi:hypothetical protein [Lacticaseibacillus manihotivorans]|uniref:DUF2188 domain-containing protein n=2 Tax=Lacticaseibacillus manihotivorans TaxID=88233 RepID=A0A0R1QJR1_9LACO|nr:hypothetical protein [Lacticaseibacillus manihotivorans]KRL45104.1 hypothetical protein FD01_GL000894 [Lacticaseibacillus manihotivorans DSM 13343 = JCM 12514]QFQ90996.1 hypothetical protein LM010_05960 [Lacticaseibacillus manihotivorans]
MKIEITHVKKYNAAWNHVISVDGTPVAIAKSARRAGLIAAYLDGAVIELHDGTLVKQLDKIKEVSR